MATDMTLFENAVDQVIVDSERLHNVVNGSAVEEVVTEDGSLIPTIRKAMLDNIYFKTPPLPWTVGAVCTVFNQLYAFKSAAGTQWFYAPSAGTSCASTWWDQDYAGKYKNHCFYKPDSGVCKELH
mgnify:CR=1 FL=1